jgi:hypothetical protein
MSTLPQAPAAANVRSASRSTIPWYLWVGALAVTSSYIGGEWDVSWHRSIGRDTFWTPAHLLLYLCPVLAGIVGFTLVIRASTGIDKSLLNASITFLGLRAPLGVFLAGWGAVAMLTSAHFDNWWHNAYGLDVKLVSPPHVLLILGLRAIALGMLLLLLAAMNRATDAHAPNVTQLQALFVYLGGLAVGSQMYFIQEYTLDTLLHRASAYIILGIAIPILFAALSIASRFRWAATTAAAIYTCFVIGEILLLPLFPAHPRLGPAFYPVTHMVPAKFPILLLPPALALDLLWQRTRTWKPWQIALLSGMLFIAILTACEWPFATFLMSPAAENRFFGTLYYGFTAQANGFERLHRLFFPQHGIALFLGLAKATVCACISTWFGLLVGHWMREVKR